MARPLKGERKKAVTICFKLTVVRSFFEYLRAGGYVRLNPASTKLVPPPAVSDEMKGRALTAEGGALPAGRPRPLAARGREGLRAAAGDAAARAAGLGGLWLARLRGALEPRAVDDPAQGQGGQGAHAAAAAGGAGRHRRVPAARPQEEGSAALGRGGRLPVPAGGQLPDAGIRQASLDADGVERRQEVGRVRRGGRAVAARLEAHGHHAGAGAGALVPAGADDERAP